MGDLPLVCGFDMVVKSTILKYIYIWVRGSPFQTSKGLMESTSIRFVVSIFKI